MNQGMKITMAHGSGGRATNELIREVFANEFSNPVLNAMDEETFELFQQYQLKNCERPELLGASSHTVDILRKY